MMKRKRSFTVFQNYLISYVGIAVFLCAVCGVYLFNFFVSGYSKSVLQTETVKAVAVLNDLEKQTSAMTVVAYSVANDLAYSSEDLAASNYTELNMLREFIRYSHGSILTKHYFLLYHHTNRVYYSIGSSGKNSTAYDYDLFLHEVLREKDDQNELYETLHTIQRDTVLQLDNGELLFCFPLRVSSNSVNAVLCYQVTKDQIEARAQMICGGSLENCEIYYRDLPLLKISDGSTRGEVVELTSDARNFRMVLRVDASQYMGRLLSYRRVTLFLFGLLGLILLLSIIMANYHAKPIRQFRQLIASGEESAEKNELNEIAMLLDRIQSEARRQKQQADRQLYLLREQAIHLLLKGEYTDKMRNMAERLNIMIEKGFVSAIVLKFEPRIGGEQFETLCRRIEDLSLDEMHFYCAADPKNSEINILLHLLAVDEHSQEDALDMLRELISVEQLNVRMGEGWIYSDPRKLTVSYAEACDKLLEKDEEFVLMTDSNLRHFERIVGAVRIGNNEDAKKFFGDFVQENEAALQSVMMQRYLFTELLSRLAAVARDMRLTISHRQLSVVLTAQDCRTACDGLLEVIEMVASHAEIKQDVDDKLIVKVLEYVKAHFAENDLSLEKLADEFHVSAGYLSRLIRTSLGMKYKDYVLRLKIELAKDCLQEGMSVTATSQKCGYANISHFIKAFKMYVGVTPSVYQKNGCVDPSPEMPIDAEDEEDAMDERDE